MLQYAARENCSLRRRKVDSQPCLLHFLKAVTNSRINLALKQAAFSVVLAIGDYRFSNPVVSIRLQQDLHQFFEWRSDRSRYIEVFVRFVSKGAQRSQAACCDARLRINQSAVEVQKNRVNRRHDRHRRPRFKDAQRARVNASQMPPPIMKPPEMRDSNRVRRAEKNSRARPARIA